MQKPFTREEIMDWTEKACALCESTQYKVVVWYTDARWTNPNAKIESTFHICDSVDDVFICTWKNFVFGREIAVFPW